MHYPETVPYPAYHFPSEGLTDEDMIEPDWGSGDLPNAPAISKDTVAPQAMPVAPAQHSYVPMSDTTITSSSNDAPVSSGHQV